MNIVPKVGLPTIRFGGEVAAHIFEGRTHGGLSCSAFIVDIGPGLGPMRHTHPYDEIFVIVEGTVRLETDGETSDVSPDEICVVPAGVAHTFTNVGEENARMVNIHASATVVTDFAPEPAGTGGAPNGYEYNRPAQEQAS